MILEQLEGRFGANYAYVIADKENGEGAIIDPSGMAGKILQFIDRHGINVQYVFNTHGHSDHTGGNAEIVERTGAKIAKHSSSAGPSDVAVNDGDILKIGELEAKVMHTPGHTPDGITILIGKNLFTGDTLFINECGRTDLPGGSSEQLWDSLFNKIHKLEDDVEVYPGHNYGPLPHDSLGNQKRTNYTLEPRTIEQFVQFMLEP
ncbi:MAG: MBL fold metallo-hydrolase [Thermoplasmata archaeon]|nr:MBL fold metallo-hydrolase [Thermoplasmata archaeon]